MKKALMLMAAIAMMVTPLFADEEAAAPTLAGLHAATGSVSFSFGDSDLSDNDGLGFTSTSAGTTASSVTASIATDKVEAGATINLVPTISKIAGTSDNATSAIEVNLSYAKDALSWYLDHNDEDDWTIPTVITKATWASNINGYLTLAAGEKGLYTEADGWNDDYKYETEADWEEVKAATAYVVNTVLNEIEALAPTLLADPIFIAVGAYDYTSDDLTVDQFGQIINLETEAVLADTTTHTQAQLDVLSAEFKALEAAYADYFDAVFENSSDDSWAASYPVSDAYFRLLAVGGVVDVEFELNGRAVSAGSKYVVESDDANIGMGVALASGVIEGLSINVLYTILAGVNDTSEDWVTLDKEAADGGEPNHAIEFNAGYTHDLFNAAVNLAIEDIVEVSDNGLWYSVQAGLTMADVMGLAVTAELTGDTNGSDDAGMVFAADAQATIFGITPSVDFRLASNVDRGGDTDDETTALSYFSTNDADDKFLGVGLAVDLTELMGMGLITLNAGMGMIFGEDMDISAGLGLNFTDLFAPITLDVAFGQAYDDDLTLGVDLGATFGNFTAGAGIDYDSSEENVGWNVDLGYTYDIVTIAAGLASDFDAVTSLDITLSTSF